MCFDSLCQQIIALTDKVESLLVAEDEAECANLLLQRQKLLEQLKGYVDATQDAKELNFQQTKLRDFLLLIQQRDNSSILVVKAKAKELLGQGSKQAKGNKAIKAYRSAF